MFAIQAGAESRNCSYNQKEEKKREKVQAVEYFLSIFWDILFSFLSIVSFFL